MRMNAQHALHGLSFFLFLWLWVGGIFVFYFCFQCDILYSDHVLKGFPPCVLQDVPNSTSILSHIVWTQFNFHV